MKPQMNTD